MMRNYFLINGKSGKQYRFLIYELSNEDIKNNISLNNNGGIYIFCKHIIPNNIKLIYCGKTHNYMERFENHHKINDIMKYKPNILGILFEDDEDIRTKIEIDILEGNMFICNTQHN